MVNNGLERMYADWEKLHKQIQELREDNESLNDQLARLRIELEYHNDSSKVDPFMDELAVIKEKMSVNIYKPQTNDFLPNPDTAQI